MEPAGAGLVAPSPPDPVQVKGFRLKASGSQAEQSFDLGDGQGDQTEILGWQVIGCDRQDRPGSPGSGLSGGDRADGERGQGEHDVPQQRSVEAYLGVVESEVVLAELEPFLDRPA